MVLPALRCGDERETGVKSGIIILNFKKSGEEYGIKKEKWRKRWYHFQ